MNNFINPQSEDFITFKDLLNLADECGEDDPISTTISYLAMSDIPMSKAVIRLGVVCGVLMDGYCNGWSKGLEL